MPPARVITLRNWISRAARQGKFAFLAAFYTLWEIFPTDNPPRREFVLTFFFSFQALQRDRAHQFFSTWKMICPRGRFHNPYRREKSLLPGHSRCPDGLQMQVSAGARVMCLVSADGAHLGRQTEKQVSLNALRELDRPRSSSDSVVRVRLRESI